MQIHAIEIGLVKMDDFVDDVALRGKSNIKLKGRGRTAEHSSACLRSSFLERGLVCPCMG